MALVVNGSNRQNTSGGRRPQQVASTPRRGSAGLTPTFIQNQQRDQIVRDFERNAMGGSQNYDPLAGLFQATPPVNPGGGGGGGGGRGRGGGGGGGGASAAQRGAYSSMYNSLKGNTMVDDAWARYEQSMKAAYDPAMAAQKWDTANSQVAGAGQAAQTNLQGILSALMARAAQGRQDVASAVSQGDTALQGIAQRFGAGAAAGTGANDVLARFGAGPVDPGTFQNELNSLFAAGQVGNQRMGTAYDAALADRPTIYQGLNADISGGVSAQQNALLGQIAARKAAEQQQMNAQLAQILGQSGISRAQAQVEKQTQLDQLMAEMAAMGIQV